MGTDKGAAVLRLWKHWTVYCSLAGRGVAATLSVWAMAVLTYLALALLGDATTSNDDENQ